jgi:hypothetical protein
MDYQWLSDRSWKVRENREVVGLLDIGDILTLQPNTGSGPPHFFSVRYTGSYTFWNRAIFYPVGINAPKVALHFDWDDTRAPENQAGGVRDDYKTAANGLRSHANDPTIARLLSYVFVESQFAIINMFCFQNAQPGGKHWFAIDSQWNHQTTEQDGTAHGDPP